MTTLPAIQDDYPEKIAVCLGCGRNNAHGLHLKSFWDGAEATARFRPAPYHTAFPGVAYGGLVASLIDCHCIATAVAGTYAAEGRAPGAGSKVAYVTGSLAVTFIRPTPIDADLVLRARIEELHPNKALVTCDLFAGETRCARGKVMAVRRAAWPDAVAAERNESL